MRFDATAVTYGPPSPATNVSGSWEKPITSVLLDCWACATCTRAPTDSASAIPKVAARLTTALSLAVELLVLTAKRQDPRTSTAAFSAPRRDQLHFWRRAAGQRGRAAHSGNFKPSPHRQRCRWEID